MDEVDYLEKIKTAQRNWIGRSTGAEVDFQTLGDLIERQFLGGAYNPQLGAAISLVMMIIVLVCMLVMNRFGEGEEQAVKL